MSAPAENDDPENAPRLQHSSKSFMAPPADIMKGAMKKAKRLGIKEHDVIMCWASFSKVDQDESGVVSMQELRTLLEELHAAKLSDDEFASITLQFDSNADGSVDFEEFLEAFCQMPEYREAHMEGMINRLASNTLLDMTDSGKDADYKANHAGVAKLAVVQWLNNEMELMDSCMMFPWAILLVIFFVLSVYYHERVSILHAIDEAITYDITENANFAFAGITPFENGRIGLKNIYDVNTVADFYSWMNLGLVSILFAESWDVSETRANTIAKCTTARQALKDYGLRDAALQSSSLESSHFSGDCPESKANGLPEGPPGWFGTPHTPTYLTYNSLVGGIRMRQERVERVTCPKEDSYRSSVHSGHCIGQGPGGLSWSPGYWLKPDARSSIIFDPALEDKPGGETIYFLSGESQSQVRRTLRDLEDRVWMGPYTQKVELVIPTYNAHVDAFTVTYIVVFINPSGHYWRRVYPVSFWLNPYHGWWGCYLFDIVWLLLVLKILVDEGRDLSLSWRENGFFKGSATYFTFSNAIDWCNIVASCVIVWDWIRYLRNVGILKDKLAQGSPGQTGTWADPAIRIAFYSQIDVIVQSTQEKTILLAMYPFVVVARLFKAMSAQPRLALVTRTITTASTDLFHFGFVFGLVFVLFAVSSLILFGPSMSEFSTLPRAIDTTFHVVIGDFDWEEMRDTSRLPAVVWFWSFTWLVQIVMFNMLLAIIMDVYTEVRGSISGDKETLWHQTYMIMRRWWQTKKGERVTLEHIRTCLVESDALTDETMLTAAGVMRAVPGLGTDQALRLISNAIERDEAQHDESQTMAEAAAAMITVRNHVTGMRSGLGNLASLQDMSVAFLKNEIRHLKTDRAKEKSNTLRPKGCGLDFSGQQSSAAQHEEIKQHVDAVARRCEAIEQHLAAISISLGAPSAGSAYSRI